MKILCVADHVDPLVYSAAIKERFKEIDLVLSAGDLPMEYLGYIASTLNKTILFVFGNHNLKHLPLFRQSVDSAQRGIYQDQMGAAGMLRNRFGSTYIGFKVKRHRNLLIAGLGGSRKYNNGENQFSDAEMRRRIIRMMPRLLWNRVFHGRYLDILLTHAAPFGINDRPDPPHIGFRPFLWFMRRFKPKYLLHGHIHLYDLNAERFAHYAQTTVINVYSHYVLELDDVDLGVRK